MAKDTVKLISAEGFEFIVDYQAACVSNTIKNMLSSTGKRALYRALQRFITHHEAQWVISTVRRQLHGNGTRRGQISRDFHPSVRESLPVFLLQASTSELVSRRRFYQKVLTAFAAML